MNTEEQEKSGFEKAIEYTVNSNKSKDQEEFESVANSPVNSISKINYHDGITLLDHFAGIYMGSILSDIEVFDRIDQEDNYIARDSYNMAEAMIREKIKRQKQK